MPEIPGTSPKGPEIVGYNQIGSESYDFKREHPTGTWNGHKVYEVKNEKGRTIGAVAAGFFARVIDLAVRFFTGGKLSYFRMLINNQSLKSGKLTFSAKEVKSDLFSKAEEVGQQRLHTGMQSALVTMGSVFIPLSYQDLEGDVLKTPENLNKQLSHDLARTRSITINGELCSYMVGANPSNLAGSYLIDAQTYTEALKKAGLSDPDLLKKVQLLSTQGVERETFVAIQGEIQDKLPENCHLKGGDIGDEARLRLPLAEIRSQGINIQVIPIEAGKQSVQMQISRLYSVASVVGENEVDSVYAVTYTIDPAKPEHAMISYREVALAPRLDQWKQTALAEIGRVQGHVINGVMTLPPIPPGGRELSGLEKISEEAKIAFLNEIVQMGKIHDFRLQGGKVFYRFAQDAQESKTDPFLDSSWKTSFGS